MFSPSSAASRHFNGYNISSGAAYSTDTIIQSDNSEQRTKSKKWDCSPDASLLKVYVIAIKIDGFTKKKKSILKIGNNVQNLRGKLSLPAPFAH